MLAAKVDCFAVLAFLAKQRRVGQLDKVEKKKLVLSMLCVRTLEQRKKVSF